MTSELLTMSQKECERLEIIQRVQRKELSQVAAASVLKLSCRQVRNLIRSYEALGAKGIISRRRGAASNNQLRAALRAEALRLISSHYLDFGPTLAHEKLCERHGLKLSVESVRQLMIKAGIWKGRRRKTAHVHQMRIRRSCYPPLSGLLSSHAWFEERGATCSLHVFVDDATSKLMALHFAPQECTQGYFDALEYYLKYHGRPQTFYSDKHSIFRVNIAEAHKGNGETQFSRALRELGIELICANSPQAKGRVEKANGTLQDRLVKELRLRGISDIAAANAFMPEYMKLYNARFAKPPASSKDMHQQAIPDDDTLALILSHQETRKISKNLEVSYNNVLYQIQTERPSYAMRGARLTVSDAQGCIKLIYKGRQQKYKTMDKRNQTTPIVSAKQLTESGKKSNKPSASHPWRRYQLVADKKHNQLNKTNG